MALALAVAAAGPVQAQIDYRSLDAGLPLRVADARVLERYAFELSMPWRLATGGGTAHTIAPELAYGFGRDWAAGLEADIVASGTASLDHASEVSAFVAFNPRRETPAGPALAVALAVARPLEGRATTRAGLTGRASRSVGRSRVHANAALTIGGDDAARWWTGLAWDVTLYRTSTLLGVELLAEDDPADGGARWSIGGGVRRQLTPTIVLVAGVRRALDRLPGATQLTLGLSHVFGVAALMPGRPR
jgi:hypothetical protein